MFSSEYSEYLSQRAEAELASAHETLDVGAMSLHYALARFYVQRAIEERAGVPRAATTETLPTRHIFTDAATPARSL